MGAKPMACLPCSARLTDVGFIPPRCERQALGTPMTLSLSASRCMLPHKGTRPRGRVEHRVGKDAFFS